MRVRRVYCRSYASILQLLLVTLYPQQHSGICSRPLHQMTHLRHLPLLNAAEVCMWLSSVVQIIH